MCTTGTCRAIKKTMARDKIKIVNDISTIHETEFPELLKEISDAPKELFIRGSLPDPTTHKYLCVVGSRKHSNYGKEVCEKLIEGLSGYPVVIVSGLALGIDSIAHRAALTHGLATVAIPGSGLNWDVLYPRGHANLGKQIIESGGALLSEFSNDFKATPYSFPQRNRLMAGMSHATLVIEATERSGTLITSRLATEYNRDVLTIPHSIFSQSAGGPHMLLRLGAVPIRNSADILEVLGLEETQKEDHSQRADLTGHEQNVMRLLSEPKARDELIKALNLPIAEANVLLSAMELKGLLKEHLGEIHRT